MTEGGTSGGTTSGDWYYCLKHKTVEEGMVCPARNRLGPYPTEADAARALEISRERNESWDKDARWQ